MFIQKFLSSIAILTLTLPVAVTASTIPILKTWAHQHPTPVVPPVLEAQSLVVSSDVKPVVLERGTYSATTSEEVKAIQDARAAAEAKAAEEAAEAERQRLLEESRKRIAAGSGASWAAVSQSNPQCATAICWPLNNFTYEPLNNGFQTSQRPDHNGFDMLAPAKTPIYAVAGGTVTLSSESHYGFGVAVVVESVIDGQRIKMTYGHMTYGTRQVQAGDVVQTGQVLGGVGSTGNSTANHLHLEIRANDALTDPQTWLQAHAG